MRRITALTLALLLAVPLARAQTEIVLTVGGDCVLATREEWIGQAGNFESIVEEKGMDWCFSGIREVFAQDDLTMVNLECVLQNSATGHNNRKQHTFRGHTDYAQMLPGASVELVNLANNHYIDYNQSGQKSTRAALDEAGVPYCGYKNLYVLEIAGYKVGFGGCRETVFLDSKPTVYRDIQQLKKQGCDVIVYSCHWGKEYSPTHNKTQQRMAQYAVNSGADIVVGTHPHVVQGVEQRDGAAVLYSLGNLVFGGTHEMKTFDATLARLTLRFSEGGEYEGVLVELIPVLTSGNAPENDFRPVLAQGKDAARILQLAQDDSVLDVTAPLWLERGKRK